MSKKNKNLVNVVYSTNPNFQYQQEEQVEHGTLPNQQQKLYVSIDKKQRAGKEVTLIEGFEGTEEDLKEAFRYSLTKQTATYINLRR
jgi:translation initiation factor 1